MNIIERNQPLVDDIKAMFYDVFPESYISITRAPLGDDTLCIKLYLQKPDEWTNKISNNDPLNYMTFYKPDTGLWREDGASFLTKPTSPHMAYSSVRMRKQTIKAANHTKIKARFNRLHAFLAENIDNAAHDVASKVRSMA